MKLKEGNIISLAHDAVYYTGKEIPEWVKNELLRLGSSGSISQSGR